MSSIEDYVLRIIAFIVDMTSINISYTNYT